MADSSDTKTSKIVHGVYGGLIGGFVFAVIMFINGTLTNMGMLTLPMIGELVGMPSAVVGFVVHMINSVVIGAIYALLFGRIGRGMVYGLHVGMLYGAVWWFIGPLTLMPMLLGSQIGSQWSFTSVLVMFPSLIGHLVYGALLGMLVGGLGPHTSLIQTEEPVRKRTDAEDAEEEAPPARLHGPLEVEPAPMAGRVPLWMTMGAIIVVFLLNVLIFGYALIDGLPQASVAHGGTHSAAQSTTDDETHREADADDEAAPEPATDAVPSADGAADSPEDDTDPGPDESE